MRYLITDDENNTLAAFDLPDAEDTATVVIERADNPDLTLCGIDLHGDGSVVVGHWPKGDEWARVFTTNGVPTVYGGGTPRRTTTPSYTLDAITRALETARDRAHGFTGDTQALNVLVGATLALLANPRSEYPNPDSDAYSDECAPVSTPATATVPAKRG